jgi:hypothetical protein
VFESRMQMQMQVDTRGERRCRRHGRDIVGV